MRTQRLGTNIVVQNRSVIGHRFDDVQHGRQNFVLDVDQLDRFFSDMDCVGGDASDRMPFVEDFFFRQHIGTEVPHVDRAFAEFDDSVALLRQIGVRHDRPHAGQCFRLGRVDRLNIRVSVRAAKHRPVEQSGQLGVGAVSGAAGDFIDAVVTDRSSSDDFVFGLFSSSHDISHRLSKVRVSDAIFEPRKTFSDRSEMNSRSQLGSYAEGVSQHSLGSAAQRRHPRLRV